MNTYTIFVELRQRGAIGAYARITYTVVALDVESARQEAIARAHAAGFEVNFAEAA